MNTDKKERRACFIRVHPCSSVANKTWFLWSSGSPRFLGEPKLRGDIRSPETHLGAELPPCSNHRLQSASRRWRAELGLPSGGHDASACQANSQMPGFRRRQAELR